MNKYLLMTSVAIMTLGIASKSWAATSGCNCGSGTDCCWKIEDGVLTIYPNPERSSTGNVTMKDFNWTTVGTDVTNGYTTEYSSNAPWQRQGATSVVVENGISNIGQYAFIGDTKITRVSGMENVTSIRKQAFAWTSSLQSVDMPNVTSLGKSAFANASSLQSVDMPNVTSIEGSAFSYSPLLTNIIISDDVNVDNWSATAFGGTFNDNANSIITCLGDVNTCKNKLRNKYGEAIANKVRPASDTQCNSSVNYYYYSSGCVKLPTTQDNCTSAGFSWVSDKCTKNAPANTEPDSEPQGQGDSQESGLQDSQVSGQATSAADCAASGKYWQEGKCVSSCGASFKLNDGWCDRLRYTPAEAAQVLTDDNNNSVTITFKK